MQDVLNCIRVFI